MHKTPWVSRRTARVMSHDAIIIPSVYDFNLG